MKYELNPTLEEQLFSTRSWLFHTITLIVSLGYGVYHLLTGINIISFVAFGASLCTLIAMWKLINETPKAVIYYLLIFSSFFALILTTHYYGVRGLILAPPFIFGVFMLLHFRIATVLCLIFLLTFIGVSYPLLENAMFLRWTISLTISYFFILTFANTIHDQYHRVEDLENTDPLTGALNRQSFLAELKKWFERKDNGHAELVFVLVNIADFRMVNREYGVDSGDQVLKILYKRLRNTVSSMDIDQSHKTQQVNAEKALISRFSNDEFMLALYIQQAVINLEMITQLILATCEHPFEVGSKTIKVSINIGLCTFSTANSELDSSISFVENALEVSKNNFKQQSLTQDT